MNNTGHDGTQSSSKVKLLVGPIAATVVLMLATVGCSSSNAQDVTQGSPAEPAANTDGESPDALALAESTTTTSTSPTTTPATVAPTTTSQEPPNADPVVLTDADWAELFETMGQTCRVIDGVDTMTYTGQGDYWLRMYDHWITLSDQVIFAPYFEIVDNGGQVVPPETVSDSLRSVRATSAHWDLCMGTQRDVDEFGDPVAIEDQSRVADRGASNRVSFTGDQAWHES